MTNQTVTEASGRKWLAVLRVTCGNFLEMFDWQSASQQLAIVVAAGLGFGLQKLMAPEDVAAGGWRIPFAIGCLLVPFLFYVRRSLEETPDFLARPKHPGLAEIMPAGLRTTGFSLAYSLATALFGGFTPAVSTWLISTTGDKASPGLWLTAAAACGAVATLTLRKRIE